MDDECIHGMNPEWCANCKKLKTAEEEAAEEDNNFEAMIKRWSNND